MFLLSAAVLVLQHYLLSLHRLWLQPQRSLSHDARLLQVPCVGVCVYIGSVLVVLYKYLRNHCFLWRCCCVDVLFASLPQACGWYSSSLNVYLSVVRCSMDSSRPSLVAQLSPVFSLHDNHPVSIYIITKLFTRGPSYILYVCQLTCCVVYRSPCAILPTVCHAINIGRACII